MQIKVTLTATERKAIADLAANQYWPQTGGFASLIAKLGKALTAKPKPPKRSRQLWQIVARPDLKAQIVALTADVGGERVHTGWRFADDAEAAAEPCAYCGERLGNSKLTPIGGDGSTPKIAHLTCGFRHLGCQAETSEDGTRRYSFAFQRKLAAEYQDRLAAAEHREAA